MKTRITFPKFIVVLCAVFAMTSAFGQTNFTWIDPFVGDLATSTNWNPTGVPSPNDAGVGDTILFDGQSSGPVSATSNTGGQTGASGGTLGLKVHLTSNQTNPVTFYTTVANTASSGIRFSDITVDTNAGSLILGNYNSVTNSLDTVWGGVSGQIHQWINNSTNPVIITANYRMRYGGGGAHTHFFEGTGNFWITNDMITANGSPTIIAKTGAGTMVWTAGNNPFTAENSSIQGPVTLNGGTMILRSPNLLSAVTTTLTFQNSDGSQPTLFEYDAGAGGTINLAFSGYIPMQVNSGTLTLSSAASSSYGNIILSGGELIAGAADNGSSGPLGSSSGNIITFSGGTLGFSANNTYDYSSRFDTSANQAYSFDTAGQNVTFSTALTSSGGALTKLSSGTLTLSSASSYTGATVINGGKLVFQSSKTGTGNITVADGTTLGVTATGTQVTPNVLSVGTSGGATLSFSGVNSTTTPVIAATTLSSASTITINVNSGTFAVGQSYPLLSWTTGPAPTVNLGVLNGYSGTLSFAGNTLKLNITGTAYSWTGTANGSWDLTTANNWLHNGSPSVFANGGQVLFDDTALGTLNVTINALIQPTSVTVNNTTNIYTIASSSGNDISGGTGLSKAGSAMLTLSGGANTYTGVTTFSGGILSVSTLANGGSASDIGAAGNNATNLVLDGGTLQYTGGGATIDRLFSVTAAGGTIDASGSAALNLTNSGAIAMSGNGSRTLTLTGSASTNILSSSLSNPPLGGTTSLIINGLGAWALTGTNLYSGATTIAGGALQVGAGGTSGSLGSGNVIDNSSLLFSRSDTITNSSVISGSGSVTLNSGTVILTAAETYAGGTTINAGTLQIGNGGVGSLANHPIVDNGLLIINSTTPTTLSAFNAIISGTGNVIVHAGTLKSIGPGNTYTGWTEIDPGATFQFIDGNSGALTSPVITNNGTLYFTAQEFYPAVRGYSNNIVGTGRVLKDNNNANPGVIVLAGTNNTYTGGTFIAGGGFQLGDGVTPGAGTIVGNVVFTNTGTANLLSRILIFNHPENFTFTNNITSVVTDNTLANSGTVEQDGTNTITLTGNNNYPGGTIISNGVIQVGAGGTSGSIGSGAISIGNIASSIVFDRSDNVTFTNAINGIGSLVQYGTGTLTLNGLNLGGANIYTGPTTVSNGTLVVTSGSLAGDLDVSGGTIVPAAPGSVGTLTVSNNMNILVGTISIQLNKSLSPSNSMFSVNGNINASGGTLNLVRSGASLVVGDKFYIFNKPVTGGGSISITSPYGTFANNLATDGSVTVTGVTTFTSTNITLLVSGNQLTLSWPGSDLGYVLQSQTNSLKTGLTNNWFDVAGSSSSTQAVITINRTNPAVFFRLRSP